MATESSTKPPLSAPWELRNAVPEKKCYCFRVLLTLLLLTVIGAGVAWHFRTPLLIKMAEAWIVNQPVQKADAILVLGGGVGWRPLEAAKLYTSGYAPKVLVVNVQPDTAVQLGVDAPEQDLVAAVLESKGVPKDAIVSIGNSSSSTWEDIKAAADWAETNKATSIIVSTDLFHTRRVRWAADRLLDAAGVQSRVVAFSPPEYKIGNWWDTEHGLIDFNNELVKYAFYVAKY